MVNVKVDAVLRVVVVAPDAIIHVKADVVVHVLLAVALLVLLIVMEVVQAVVALRIVPVVTIIVILDALKYVTVNVEPVVEPHVMQHVLIMTRVDFVIVVPLAGDTVPALVLTAAGI